MPIFASIALIVMAGGGTSLAAEAALPGDLLYPVKVVVNEEVRAALAFSAEARADWEARRAERRLEEAEQLMIRGSVDAETENQLNEHFEAHADRVKDRIAEFEARGNIRVAADVVSRFETSLRVHERILSRVAARNERTEAAAPSAAAKIVTAASSSATGTSISIRAGAGAEAPTSLKEKPAVRERSDGEIVARIGIRARVSSKAIEVRNLRVGIESRIAAEAGSETKTRAKTAAEGKLKAAANVLRATEKLLAERREKLGAEATVQAEARVAAAKDVMARANGKFEAGAYGEAFNLGNEIIRIAQEARLLMEARTDLDVDVRIGNGESGHFDSENGERRTPQASTEARSNGEAGSGPGTPGGQGGIDADADADAEAEAETETSAGGSTGGGLHVNGSGTIRIGL